MESRSQRLSVSLNAIAAWVPVGALVAFALIDLTSYGVAWIERVGYGLVYISVLFAAAAAMPFVAASRQSWLLLSGWLLGVTIFLVPTAGQRFVYPSYIFGDFLSLLLPALLLIAGWRADTLFSRHYVIVLAAGLLVVSVMAPIFGVSGARFEPPPTLLVAIVWWGAHTARRPSHRLILGVVVLLLGFLALESGQRTALIIWVACGTFVAWRAVSGSRWAVLFTLCGVLAIAGIAATAGRDAITDLVSGYRIGTIATGDRDDSLLARVNEATDVSATMSRDGSAFNWIAGFGHGATYRPQRSFLSRNVTPEGRVHNVHIGPLLMLLRYGLCGLLVYLGAWIIAMRGIARTVKTDGPDGVSGALALAAGAYLVKSLMFNVLVDPLFSFAFAGLLMQSVRRQSPLAPGLRGNAVQNLDSRQHA